MTEVEISKMFENAGIETKYKLCCTGCKHIAKLEVINGCPSKWICDKYDEVANCDKAKLDYPPFTAEKQIELIKKIGNINIDIDNGCYMSSEILKVEAHCDEFEETLAEFVNNLWQSLTDQEKEEIRNILDA